MPQQKPADKISWMARAKLAAKAFLIGVEETDSAHELEAAWGHDGVSFGMLLGSGRREARSRVQIYQKWHFMAGDPIISSALRLHVTQALGGHETTGDTVFLEATPEAEQEKGQRLKVVDELQRDLAHLFNRVAHPVAFNGAAFGDAYARVYAKDKVGVVDLYTDEMVYPPLVQPYEQGNKTAGFVVSVGERMTTRLTIKQMVRMKMPRLLYVPQMRVIEKAARIALEQDELEGQPLLPSLVGGSFLDAAEESYDNLVASISGLVGQRILSTIDETLVSANMDGMTAEQRKAFSDSFKRLLTTSKTRAEQAVKEGRPVTERIYHFLPAFGDKQAVSLASFQGSGTGNSISIEDIMLHARMLSGALGIDLAMLGFADQLSGGLGDGGFFRVSAQAAERSRIIRTALTQFFHDVVDLHTLHKYGWVFEDGDRPYKINFFGSISALQNEQEATRERSINATAMLVQTLTQLRDLGMPKEANKQLLAKSIGLDEDMAELIANGMAEAKPPADGGGGFGGVPGEVGDDRLPPEPAGESETGDE